MPPSPIELMQEDRQKVALLRSVRTRQLVLLVGVEFWERYSAFGLKIILVLFLTGSVRAMGLGWSAPAALVLFALFSGSTFLLAVIGGWVADHHGARRSALLGGWLIVAGHGVLAIPLVVTPLIAATTGTDVKDVLFRVGGPIGDFWHEEQFTSGANRPSNTTASEVRTALFMSRCSGATLLLGLALVCLGTGLFKPSVTTLVSHLYPPSDPARETGYGWFYMGINGGTALGILLCGYIGERVGWHIGLLSAAIGFTCALLAYVVLDRSDGIAQAVATAKTRSRFFPAGSEWKPILLIGILFPFSVVYWMGAEQMGGLLSIFAKGRVDRAVLGFEVPTAWLALVNPIAIIILAPLFGRLWSWLELRGRNPLAIDKFATSLALLAAGYALLGFVGADEAGTPAAPVRLIWPLTFYLVLGISELLLQPVALAQIGRYAPRRLEAMVVGLWYLSIAAGGLFAGLIGSTLKASSFAPIFWVLFVASSIGSLTAYLVRGIYRRLVLDLDTATPSVSPSIARYTS
jgi:proton-dependent oligopeptide transporter, POT family